MSTTTTVHLPIGELSIFKNGLLSELQALTPLKNELKKKEGDLKTKELSIVDSVVKKLISHIPAKDDQNLFLLQASEKQQSLLHELVTSCLSFSDGKSKEVRFCKKPLCFFTVETAGETAMKTVEKMNEIAKKFEAIAHFHADHQVSQICFSFSLK
jgi:hypothetical protein